MVKERRVVLPMVALVLCAFAWGSTVVVAKSAYETVSPGDLLILRLLLTGLSLSPLIGSLKRATRRTILRGIALGAMFNGALAAQMFGLQYTAPSLSSFITASYVVFTVLISAVLLRQRQPTITWLAVVLTVVGIAILALGHEGGAGFGFGAAITLLGAVGFAVQIVYLGRWVRRDNVRALTFLQAAVGAVVAAAFIPFTDVGLGGDTTTWLQVLYLGIFCGGVTLFLQSWAQNYVPPTPASVVMCTEPVWGALLAISFGFEPLTVFVVTGGLLVVAALLLIVMPRRSSTKLDTLVSDLRRRRSRPPG